MHLVDPLIQETRAFASGMEAALGHREAAVVDAVAAYAARHEHGLRIVGDYETLRDLALGTMPIDERLAALLQGTRALLDAKVAAVLLLDEQGHELWPRVSSGFETPVGVSPMPVNGRIRKVVADAQPIVIDEVGTQEPFDQRLRREGVQSAVVVPLTVGSKVEGAVLCAHPGTGRFTERDVTLLGLVAHRMGVGLDRGRILDAQVRRRETAEAQSQFRKTLLHMATHDLKTPLTAIGMQLHLMAAPEVPEAQRRKAMAMVQRNVKRLGEMLDDFLDLARIEAGRLTLTPTEFDAVALLRECAEVFEAQALQKGLRIEVSAPDSLMAYGDPRRVAQVLANLVSNAIQFSSTGTITLLGRQGGHAVELQVRDLGRGLAQAEVGKLFQPFAQVEGGTHHGTGLGLYLSKAIVDAHGGSIRLESQGLGKGTTATVELPCRLTLAQVDAQEAAGQRPQDPVPASP